MLSNELRKPLPAGTFEECATGVPHPISRPELSRDWSMDRREPMITEGEHYEDAQLATPMVYGFSLADRKWRELFPFSLPYVNSNRLYGSVSSCICRFQRRRYRMEHPTVRKYRDGCRKEVSHSVARRDACHELFHARFCGGERTWAGNESLRCAFPFELVRLNRMDLFLCFWKALLVSAKQSPPKVSVKVSGMMMPVATSSKFAPNS